MVALVDLVEAQRSQAHLLAVVVELQIKVLLVDLTLLLQTLAAVQEAVQEQLVEMELQAAAEMVALV
jgi:hypothetical protein